MAISKLLEYSYLISENDIEEMIYNEFKSQGDSVRRQVKGNMGTVDIVNDTTNKIYEVKKRLTKTVMRTGIRQLLGYKIDHPDKELVLVGCKTYLDMDLIQMAKEKGVEIEFCDVGELLDSKANDWIESQANLVGRRIERQAKSCMDKIRKTQWEIQKKQRDILINQAELNDMLKDIDKYFKEFPTSTSTKERLKRSVFED